MDNFEILLASRSWSNEAEGKQMYASLVSSNGIVMAYFSTRKQAQQMAEFLKIALPKEEINGWQRWMS